MAGPDTAHRTTTKRRNGQRTANKAGLAERDAKMFQAKVQGKTVREIAASFGLAPATVHERLDKAMAALTNPLAEEQRALSRARVDDLRRKAHAIFDGTEDREIKLKTLDRLIKIEERDAKLNGLDAREPIEIILAQRTELEGDAVAATLTTVLDGLVDVLDADQSWATSLRNYMFELAQWALLMTAGQDPGPRPEPPRPVLAITAGPTEHVPDVEQPLPHPAPPDPADRVVREAIIRARGRHPASRVIG